MKKHLVLFCLSLLVIFPSPMVYGFIDDLLRPPSKKAAGQEDQEGQERNNGESKPQEKRKGLIEGIGGILGAKERDIELIKKGLKTVQALQPIGEEEEIAIGQAVAVEAFSRFGGEYANVALTRYVNLVGKTVAEVSDRPELTYHFAILDSAEQNAFAAPGGYILVTRGLLATLKNEAELAGVLAHEVAHVTHKHMLETIRRSSLLANVSDFTFSAMKKNPELFSNVIREVTDKLFEKGLDKDLEYEADAIGITYAYRAGYNPRGLYDYLTTLQGLQGRVSSRFFSTHPSTSIRIKKCGLIIRQYPDGQAFPFVDERYTTMLRGK